MEPRNICDILLTYNRQRYIYALRGSSKFEYSLCTHVSYRSYLGKIDSIWWPYLQNNFMIINYRAINDVTSCESTCSRDSINYFNIIITRRFLFSHLTRINLSIEWPWTLYDINSPCHRAITVTVTLLAFILIKFARNSCRRYQSAGKMSVWSRKRLSRQDNQNWK